MQPFDALSIRAVLQEAKPLLLNRKVDKVTQLGRDEILIALRSKGGSVNLFLSAQSVYGRICLVRIPSSTDSTSTSGGERSIQERYKSKYGNQSPPNFCLVLRKALTGATLIGIEQLAGERVVDFIFSCIDQVGSSSIKILTAEIMGRHSNLIFWDKDSNKILSASHVVTREMSRQREVLPGLEYERPPGQDRQNIFAVSKAELQSRVNELRLFEASRGDKEAASKEEEIAGNGSKSNAAPGMTVGTVEQWLVSTFTGLGKHLAEEIVSSTELSSKVGEALEKEDCADRLWEKVKLLQEPATFEPSFREDLVCYSILGWSPRKDKENENNDWKSFPSVNDMVEQYFRSLEAREMFIQLREKIKSEINAEATKLESRKDAASTHLTEEGDLGFLKQAGDIILANLAEISPGQTVLTVESWSEGNGDAVTIKLNPDITSVQNAQNYYRKFAKQRARQSAAKGTLTEVDRRLEYLNGLRKTAEEATEIQELRKIKDTLSGGKQEQKARSSNNKRTNKNTKTKTRSLSVTSSDGWTIYVGRNRMENDHLLNRLANPNDLWFHVLGQGGAHVLVRVPASKQSPPKATIQEAAQIAARMSKAPSGAKVRVVYTQCKHVRKLGKNKTGQVQYENERTVEVDTSKPMPGLMRRLFK